MNNHRRLETPKHLSKAVHLIWGTTQVVLVVKDLPANAEVRRGGREEIPLVQGKEQRLRFAGAAVKGYPMSKVKET